MTGVTITEDKVNRKLGVAIKNRRIELGLSQKAVAQTLAITFQQIQKYEKGTNALSVFRLSQIAGRLGLTAEGLLATAMGDKPRAAGVLSDRATLEMMKRAHLLTEQELKAVSSFIQDLTEGRTRQGAAATNPGNSR